MYVHAPAMLNPAPGAGGEKMPVVAHGFVALTTGNLVRSLYASGIGSAVTADEFGKKSNAEASTCANAALGPSNATVVSITNDPNTWLPGIVAAKPVAGVVTVVSTASHTVPNPLV